MGHWESLNNSSGSRDAGGAFNGSFEGGYLNNGSFGAAIVTKYMP